MTEGKRRPEQDPLFACTRVEEEEVKGDLVLPNAYSLKNVGIFSDFFQSGVFV